jgi:hypothetical protein
MTALKNTTSGEIIFTGRQEEFSTTGLEEGGI